MSKLIIMRGLPASGKSTRAKEVVEQSGNAVRINQDLLRTMLHYDKFTVQNEKFTAKAKRELIKYFLTQTNRKVVVDDTNLNPSTLESIKNIAKECKIEFQVITMETDIEECIRRDSLREKKVGREVIINMARRYGLYDFKNSEVIVDIDGTLADIEHRRHFVEQDKKDWKSFFEAMGDDPVREEVLGEVRELSKSHDIVLVSGRPERYKQETLEWLDKHNVPRVTLLMRGMNDSRPDDIVKEEILNNYFVKSKIFLVIDDRPRVIRMWQRNGLNVKDVGDGVEF